MQYQIDQPCQPIGYTFIFWFAGWWKFDVLLINMDIWGRIYSVCPPLWPPFTISVAFIFIGVMLGMEDTVTLMVKCLRWVSFDG